jgi:hypothetical protein
MIHHRRRIDGQPGPRSGGILPAYDSGGVIVKVAIDPGTPVSYKR